MIFIREALSFRGDSAATMNTLYGGNSSREISVWRGSPYSRIWLDLETIREAIRLEREGGEDRFRRWTVPLWVKVPSENGNPSTGTRTADGRLAGDDSPCVKRWSTALLWQSGRGSWCSSQRHLCIREVRLRKKRRRNYARTSRRKRSLKIFRRSRACERAISRERCPLSRARSTWIAIIVMCRISARMRGKRNCGRAR